MDNLASDLIWAERFDIVPSSHRLDVGGATALFCERTQKLVGFNGTAALIWECLARQGSALDAVSRLMEQGLPPAKARDFVEQVGLQWLRSGHITPTGALASGVTDEVACMLSVGKVTLRLHGSIESEPFRAALRGFQGVRADEIACFDLVEKNGAIVFFRNGSPCGARPWPEAMPLLKAMLVDEYANNVGDGFLAHGALLRHGEETIFLSGQPGAGKTTLALALADAGFRYCSDDLVHIDGQGRALGLCFPAAVKPGAWPLLSAFPGAKDAPIHLRGDGVQVRYLLPQMLGPQTPRPITLFVRLQRTKQGAMHTSPISGLSSLCALLEGGWSERHKIDTSLMRALADKFARARHYDLFYSRLDDGVAGLSKVLAFEGD